MSTPLLLIAALAALAVLYVEMPVMSEAYLRYRGKKTVRCPDTGEPAMVEVDAKYAAATAAFGHSSVRLVKCSRWPEMHECGRECSRQI